MEFDRSQFCEENDAGTEYGLNDSVKLVAPNIPENNQLKMLDYRNRKVAAFSVNGRTLICLPQAFEFFLKNLVGGLHTVYTKLKRLEVTPVVCNVEQVRVLRTVAAIQPGVNRCKLIAPSEFDTLYDDCTNSTARPGRPPKRQFQSTQATSLFLPTSQSSVSLEKLSSMMPLHNAAFPLLPVSGSDSLSNFLHAQPALNFASAKDNLASARSGSAKSSSGTTFSPPAPAPAFGTSGSQVSDNGSPWSISHILAGSTQSGAASASNGASIAAAQHNSLDLFTLANYLQFPYANAAVQHLAALANAANNNASHSALLAGASSRSYATYIRQITSTLESLLGTGAGSGSNDATPADASAKCDAAAPPQSPSPKHCAAENVHRTRSPEILHEMAPERRDELRPLLTAQADPLEYPDDDALLAAITSKIARFETLLPERARSSLHAQACNSNTPTLPHVYARLDSVLDAASCEMRRLKLQKKMAVRKLRTYQRK